MTNVGNALFGRIPGLIVSQGGGQPGNDLPQLFIRGLANFTNSGVLVFVDGFEYSYEGLSLEEIESITILKDAASTAPYGIRGANGVVLITTKRGKKGNTQIGANFHYGIQQPTQLPEFLNSYDYSRLYNEALVNDGRQAIYTDEDLQAFKDGSDPYFHPNVNWFDEILKKQSPVFGGNLNISGGSDFVRYYVLMDFLESIGPYDNTTGMFPDINTNEDFQRYVFRSNFDVTLSKTLNASVILGGRLINFNSPGTSSNVIWEQMYRLPPNLFPVMNPDGSLGGTQLYRHNPMALVSKAGYSETDDRRFQGTFRLTEKLDFITKGLSASAAVSFNNWFTVSDIYTRQFAVYELSEDASGEIVYNIYGEDESLTYSNPSDQNNHSNFEARLDYGKGFDQHQIDAMLMYQQDRFIISGNDLPYGHQGVAGRVQYGYKNRYFGELTFGLNGSESFPKGHRFGFFPALSAAWVISEEDFLKDNQILNYLKVRGSFGLVGNDNLGMNLSGNDRFMYISTYRSGTRYYFGSSNSSASSIDEGFIANPDFTWEKSYKKDLGVEMKLINDFDFMLDLFHEKRTDLFSPRALEFPEIFGVGWSYENYGEVINKGFETSLLYDKKINEIGIIAGINLAYNHSTIKKRKEFYPVTKGHSVTQYFGLEAIGFFSDQSDIDNSPVQTFGQVTVGDIKYKDQNGDNIIDNSDMVPVGKNWIPELDYGINLGISYKGISLSAFLQGQSNRSIYISDFLAGPIGSNAQFAEFAMNSYSASNTNAAYPRLTTTDNPNNYRENSIWVMDGSFIKIRSLELAFQIPKKVIEHLAMSSAKLYLRGMNLFSKDKFDSLDLEILSGYPAMKTCYAGVRFEF